MRPIVLRPSSGRGTGSTQPPPHGLSVWGAAHAGRLLAPFLKDQAAGLGGRLSAMPPPRASVILLPSPGAPGKGPPQTPGTLGEFDDKSTRFSRLSFALRPGADRGNPR